MLDIPIGEQHSLMGRPAGYCSRGDQRYGCNYGELLELSVSNQRSKDEPEVQRTSSVTHQIANCAHPACFTPLAHKLHAWKTSTHPRLNRAAVSVPREYLRSSCGKRIEEH